mmetsp:Transcript_24587/g.56736  ORF Transcript_24587/g.56736 Transcript_24587/m.56736 type:complete len:219 (+) Transcript_24587:542-1198(+)
MQERQDHPSGLHNSQHVALCAPRLSKTELMRNVEQLEERPALNQLHDERQPWWLSVHSQECQYVWVSELPKLLHLVVELCKKFFIDLWIKELLDCDRCAMPDGSVYDTETTLVDLLVHLHLRNLKVWNCASSSNARCRTGLIQSLRKPLNLLLQSLALPLLFTQLSLQLCSFVGFTQVPASGGQGRSQVSIHGPIAQPRRLGGVLSCTSSFQFLHALS